MINTIKSISKVLVLTLAFVLSAVHANAQTIQGQVQGYAELGGQKVTTGFLLSSTKVQASYPGALVRVKQLGTQTDAAIYSDTAGTVKANPFNADANGYFNFYTNETYVDVQLSGGGLPSLITRTYYVTPAAGANTLTQSAGDARYLKLAADNDPLTSKLTLAAAGIDATGDVIVLDDKVTVSSALTGDTMVITNSGTSGNALDLTNSNASNPFPTLNVNGAGNGAVIYRDTGNGNVYASSITDIPVASGNAGGLYITACNDATAPECAGFGVTNTTGQATGLDVLQAGVVAGGFGLRVTSRKDISAIFQSSNSANTSPTVSIRESSSITQAANTSLLEFMDQSGTIVGKIDAEGDITAQSATLNGTAAGTLLIKPSSAPAANTLLFDFQSSAGSSLASIDTEGDLIFAGTAVFNTTTVPSVQVPNGGMSVTKSSGSGSLLTVANTSATNPQQALSVSTNSTDSSGKIALNSSATGTGGIGLRGVASASSGWGAELTCSGADCVGLRASNTGTNSGSGAFGINAGSTNGIAGRFLSDGTTNTNPTLVAQDNSQPANTKMFSVRSAGGSDLAFIDKEGDLTAVNGVFSGPITATSANFSAGVTGTTGTFSGAITGASLSVGSGTVSSGAITTVGAAGGTTDFSLSLADATATVTALIRNSDTTDPSRGVEFTLDSDATDGKAITRFTSGAPSANWITGLNGTKDFEIRDAQNGRLPFVASATDGTITVNPKVILNTSASATTTVPLDITNSSATGSSILRMNTGTGTSQNAYNYLNLRHNYDSGFAFPYYDWQVGLVVGSNAFVIKAAPPAASAVYTEVFSVSSVGDVVLGTISTGSHTAWGGLAARNNSSNQLTAIYQPTTHSTVVSHNGTVGKIGTTAAGGATPFQLQSNGVVGMELDTSQNLKLEKKITEYDNIATAGQGIAPINGSVNLTVQTASIATANLYASAPAGHYRVCWTQTITTAATTSSSLQTTIGWNNGAAKTSTYWVDASAGTTGTAADTSNTLGSERGNCISINVAASTNITYATTYSSTGATAMQYRISASVERIN